MSGRWVYQDYEAGRRVLVKREVDAGSPSAAILNRLFEGDAIGTSVSVLINGRLYHYEADDGEG